MTSLIGCPAAAAWLEAAASPSVVRRKPDTRSGGRAAAEKIQPARCRIRRRVSRRSCAIWTPHEVSRVRTADSYVVFGFSREQVRLLPPRVALRRASPKSSEGGKTDMAYEQEPEYQRKIVRKEGLST